MDLGIVLIVLLIMDIIANLLLCCYCKARKEIVEAQNEMLKELLKPWVFKEEQTKN